MVGGSPWQCSTRPSGRNTETAGIILFYKFKFKVPAMPRSAPVCVACARWVAVMECQHCTAGAPAQHMTAKAQQLLSTDVNNHLLKWP
jgi:hypothetical protein